jgi:hypothetical protein
MALLMGTFGYLAASSYDSALDEGMGWKYDLVARTATRSSDGAIFKITYCEKTNPDEKLPAIAVQDTWYPFYITGKLDLSEAGPAVAKEEIKGHLFKQLVSELSYTIVEGDRSSHAHYGDPFKVKSGFPPRTVTRYKCYACEGIQVLMRVLRRAAGGELVTTVEESPTVVRHVRGADIGHDFTNPESQDYGTGKITPFPEGIGSVNKQTFENTFKRWFS